MVDPAQVPYEEDAMPMYGLKIEKMALKRWENIKLSFLKFRYVSILRQMKAVVDVNRGHICKMFYVYIYE